MSDPNPLASGTRRSNHLWLWIGLVALILIGAGTAFLLIKGQSTAETYPPEEEVIAAARQRYDVVGTFKENRVIVGKDGKWGVIDRYGKEVIPLRYYSRVYEEDLAEVLKFGKYRIVDSKNNIVIPLEYYFGYIGPFCDGLAEVEKDGKIGVIDTAGNVMWLSEGITVRTRER